MILLIRTRMQITLATNVTSSYLVARLIPKALNLFFNRHYSMLVVTLVHVLETIEVTAKTPK